MAARLLDRGIPTRCADLSPAMREAARERLEGREGFLGLSALDLGWAAFSNMLAPLPHELCPMSDFMRSMYTCTCPEVINALDPELVLHRDRIFRDVIGLPLDF